MGTVKSRTAGHIRLLAGMPYRPRPESVAVEVDPRRSPVLAPPGQQTLSQGLSGLAVSRGRDGPRIPGDPETLALRQHRPGVRGHP